MQRLKAWLPAAVWMGVIFIMSAMPGEQSADQSGTLVNLVLWLVQTLFGAEAASQLSPDAIHLLVRKGAHMAEYAVLFFCYRRALKYEGVRHPGLYALLLCSLYAASDEWHQSFTEGRGPSPVDVGIDTIGAAIAWAGISLFSRVKIKEC